MSRDVSVTVVIVSHARPEALALALKALEYQRHRRFEVVVVADTPEAEPRSPLGPRWIRFEDRNISAARNLGIAAARGELVAFCDDDAVPEFDWLTELQRPFEDPAVGAAGGYVRGRNGVSFQWRCTLFDATGLDHPVDPAPEVGRVFAGGDGRYLKTVGTNCMFRRAALAGIGGFDEAFRFFLDEADVNIRLARAGWSAAIVPTAEVHHGYAAGPHRSARRVPTSLFELGVSLRHFLRKHADPTEADDRLAAFRAEQMRRLDAHFAIGQLAGAERRRLLATLEAGFGDGATRMVTCRDLPGTGDFVPAPRVASGARRVFVAGPGAAAGERHARQAALAGDETTLIAWEPSHRPLRVGFEAPGLFRHRLGLFGRSERDRPRPPPWPGARITREIDRMTARRGPFETA